MTPLMSYNLGQIGFLNQYPYINYDNLSSMFVTVKH